MNECSRRWIEIFQDETSFVIIVFHQSMLTIDLRTLLKRQRWRRRRTNRISYIDANVTIFSTDRRHFRAEWKGIGSILTVEKSFHCLSEMTIHLLATILKGWIPTMTVLFVVFVERKRLNVGYQGFSLGCNWKSSGSRLLDWTAMWKKVSGPLPSDSLGVSLANE